MRALQTAVALCLATLTGFVVVPATAGAVTLPVGFGEEEAFGGLVAPTAVEFAPDGRVFVAEKSGLIRMFSGPEDETAQVVADLRTNVHNFWDRGLLDIALPPDFASQPYIYALYTHDAEIGETAPRWGTPDTDSDPCPNPPGATGDGCIASGRLSRMPLSGDTAGPEQVLIEDWCQQYPSHSIGSIGFDVSGNLYASGGDGASFNFVDWGRAGDPINPCGDPPAGAGGVQSPPEAEGGALRSQDFRTPGTDPTGLNGTIIRVDPSDGSAPADNPRAGHADPNARRLVGEGLRNPFRFAIRPGTSELWIGDVGWGAWEEINRLDPASPDNFGWPCEEGPARQPGYDGADLTICEDLYGSPGSTAAPFFSYSHSDPVVPAESCPTGGSSIAGLAFYEDGPFPASYDGALFFADYSRTCIWAMQAGAGGVPDPSTVETFGSEASNPVNLEAGTDGALYYPDLLGGTIRAIRYFDGNQPPTAVATADPDNGPGPLTVQFDGTGSSDPDPEDTLTYEWDLDGDGDFDDSTSASPSRTYQSAGDRLVKLRVTDDHGAAGTAKLTIAVGNTTPVPTIDSPLSSLRWAVGDDVPFAGTAGDAEEGTLPPSALDWAVTLQHCPSNCHTHPLQSFPGVESGSFPAPDHEFPAALELTLTATDSGGLKASTSVLLDPSTTEIRLEGDPAEIPLTLNGTTSEAPFTTEVIVGSTNTISAPSSLELGTQTWDWRRWDQGGPRTQAVVASDSDATFTALYVNRDESPPDTRILGGPSGWIKDRTPTFTLGPDEQGISFGCRSGDDPYRLCSGPGNEHTTPPLPDGVHRFQARGTDAAGNTDPGSATRTVKVDTRAPKTAVTGVKGKRTKRRPKFKIRADEPTSALECKLDGRRWRDCDRKERLDRVPRGRHVFKARAHDRAGNWDRSPAKRRFRITRR